METKRCSKCRDIKSLDNFRFLLSANRHHSWCKDCEKDYRQARKDAPDQKPLYNPRKYAITAIRNYVDRFGKDIIKEALGEK